MSKLFKNKTKFILLVSSDHSLRMMGFIVLLSPSYQMPGSYIEIGHNCTLKILIQRLPSLSHAVWHANKLICAVKVLPLN
jgi:hypothetical protein